jgi:squalene synthase HpnC
LSWRSRRGRISGTTDIAGAFAWCEHLTRSHYENFPVASLFIPRDKRPYVCAVYAFARTADDFADEGDDPPAVRLRNLDDWGEKLDAAYRGRTDHPVFVAIAETAARTGIQKSLLADLLTAFRLDVTKKRYSSAAELLQYCAFSANPVGRIVLQIFDGSNERSCALSDSICTGLQLANFAQDVSMDWRKGRLYVPLDDMSRFGYTEKDLEKGTVDRRFRELMTLQVDRARGLLREGSPLIAEGPRAIRFELALTVQGGLAILKRVEQIGFDVLSRRPVIPLMEKARIVVMAIARRNAWTSQPTL